MKALDSRERNAVLFGFVVGIASPILYIPLLKLVVPGMSWFGIASATTVGMVLAIATGVGAGRLHYRTSGGSTNKTAGAQSNRPKADRQSTVVAALIVTATIVSMIGLGVLWAPFLPTAILLSVMLIVTPFLFGIWRGSLEDAENKAALKHIGPVTPSARAAKVIPPAESIRLDVRRHPIYVSHYALIVVVAAVVARWIGVSTGNATLALGFFIVVAAYPAWKILAWYRTRLVITTWRYLEISGIFVTKSPGSAVKSFTDLTVVIPYWSYVLTGLRIIPVHYGHLTVETPGQDQANTKVKYVPEVIAINQILVSEAFSPSRIEEIDREEDSPIQQLADSASPDNDPDTTTSEST